MDYSSTRRCMKTGAMALCLPNRFKQRHTRLSDDPSLLSWLTSLQPGRIRCPWALPTVG
jgi:hypothetical protein